MKTEKKSDGIKLIYGVNDKPTVLNKYYLESNIYLRLLEEL